MQSAGWSGMRRTGNLGQWPLSSTCASMGSLPSSEGKKKPPWVGGIARLPNGNRLAVRSDFGYAIIITLSRSGVQHFVRVIEFPYRGSLAGFQQGERGGEGGFACPASPHAPHPAPTGEPDERPSSSAPC